MTARGTPPRQDTATQRVVDTRRQQRLPGPEALQAAVLHHAVVLQGRLEGQPRLQGRLRLEARSPQPVQRSAVRHLLPRQQRRARAGRHLQLRRSPASTTSSTTSGWVNDTWKLTDRLTLNLGAALRGLQGRVARAVARRRTAIPALAGWTDPRYSAFIAPQDRRSADRRQHQHVSPQVGFAYDLTGDNRTVLKALLRPVALELGRRAGRPGEPGRPRAAALRVRVVRGRPVPPAATSTATACVDSPPELGAFHSTQGGGGFVRVDRDLVRPMSQRGLGQPRARDHERPVGPRVVRLQEHAQRLGRDRRRPRRRLHRAVHVHRSGPRPRRRHGRRSDVQHARPCRPASAAIACSPTPTTTTPTSTTSSSR